MTPYAFVFPGQGSQHPGMGQVLAEAFPVARETFERADAVDIPSMTELCFGGSAEALALTENTQPAILTVSIAALNVLASHGVDPPAAVAGHSLGEYSAHVAAGTLPFEDALMAVHQRGRFMQQAVPVGQGAMAAILGIDGDSVAKLCREGAEGEVVAPANLNSAQQTVIAGSTAAVERVIDLARGAGAKRAMMLPVSAPFHCELMEPARRRLAALLSELDFQDPGLPVWSNVDVQPVADAAAARETLTRQVTAAVRWHETIDALVAQGIETFVEVGPGKVLSGLIRRIHRPARVLQAGDADAVAQVAEALGA